MMTFFFPFLNILTTLLTCENFTETNSYLFAGPPSAIDDSVSPTHVKESYQYISATDNVDIAKYPLNVG